MENRFTNVPVEYIDWQNSTHAHQYAAMILSVVKSIYDNRSVLKIKENDNGFMVLTTKFIQKNLCGCLDSKTIRRALQSLKDAQLIDYETNNVEIYIRLNDENIAKLVANYSNSDTNLKFFKIYHFSIKTAQQLEQKASFFIALMASKFLDEFTSGVFKEYMSTEYMVKKFGNIFSRKQIIRVENILQKNGYLEKTTKRYEDEGWTTLNKYKLNYEKLKNDAFEFNKAQYTYTYTLNEDIQSVKVVVAKDQSRAKNESYEADEKVVVVNSGSHITKDRLKSGSYTKEEKEEFKRKAEELEAAGEKWIF